MPCSSGIRREIECIIRHHFAALNCLQENVVKIPSNPGAFSQSFIEPGADRPCNPPKPKPVKDPEKDYRGSNADGIEPIGLEPGSRDDEAKRRAGCVPHSVIVRRDDVESVVPWGQMSEIGLRAPTRFMPF